jgi:hypothetical protein
MDDDTGARELANVFLQARQLLHSRQPHGRDITMEMDGCDLLMDYALLLGPTGVADVWAILMEEQRGEAPATSSQVASAITFVLNNEGSQGCAS